MPVDDDTAPPARPPRRKSRRPPRSAATATPVAPDAPVTDAPPVPAPVTAGQGRITRMRRAGAPPPRTLGEAMDRAAFEDDAPRRGTGRDSGW